MDDKHLHRCTKGTGSPLPGSAIPTVGHWGGLGLGLGVRVRVKVRVRVRLRVRVRG